MTHARLYNTPLPLTSPLLARFADPSSSLQLPQFPPLPPKPVPWSIICTPAIGRARNAHRAPPNLPLSTTKPPQSGHHKDTDCKPTSSTFLEIEDLQPMAIKSGHLHPLDILIQKQHPTLSHQFSTPQAMEAKLFQPPPSTFSFQVLAQHIAEQGDYAFQP
jgi:hypothetical protein